MYSVSSSADIVVVGATPGGIAAAMAAAQQGLSVVILERSSHIGGLPSNGLGATDISTRGVAAGLFREMTMRIRSYYVSTYGEESPQVKVCSDGYHFEPSVAEKVLLEMLAECPTITVLSLRQFDAVPARVQRSGGKLTAIEVLNLETGKTETYGASAFIDATYEGDLAAAANVPFATRRESAWEYREPLAGRVYKPWGIPETGDGSTGEGDDTIQAYNFRVCLTDNPANRIPIAKPERYERSEYASLIDDLKQNRFPGVYAHEREWDGIGRITNIVWLPNQKTDGNNQHLAFVSTDLPEENYAWPTAGWAWRDQFQARLREYTLGLFWFLQNDPEVPASFQENAKRFGLAADEYEDNGHFPRQVYVREGRRIVGENSFLAHDAIPTSEGGRPPLHASSIAASHYPIDSHAIHKREPGRVHLDGFVSIRTQPYTVPYGVIVPKTVDNLWVPVAVSASHLGFGTLRMEPCWMALGEAAGAAAALGVMLKMPSRTIPMELLQRQLIARGAMLIYYRDVGLEDPVYGILQYLGVRGAIPEWEAKLDAPLTESDWNRWCHIAGVRSLLFCAMSRREALMRLADSLDLQLKFSEMHLISA